MKRSILLVLAIAGCVDNGNEAGTSGDGKADGTGQPSIAADPVSKVFGIATFEVTREASGFSVIGRDVNRKQIAQALIYDTRNEITVRNVDGRTASFTSDASGDRSVYRINTLTVTIMRDATGAETYTVHDDGGATEDVSLDGSDASTMAMQSDQLTMDTEISAIFAEPVAVLLSRIMLDTNLAAELAHRRATSREVVAAGGFCDGALPSDVKLALDAKTITSCSIFVGMTALSVPAIQVTLATGEVGPLVILSFLDAGLGVWCLKAATNRSSAEALKLLPCAVAYIAGLR